MPNDKVIFDVTIIGGGPAGMYAAFYGGMRDLKIKLIEAKSELGGFMHMYPEKLIWDIGAVPPTRCETLIGHLEQQARTFDPTIVFNQRVQHFARLEDGTIELLSDTGEKHYSRTVILAIGRGITNIQKLDIEGADRYEISNLHYTVQQLDRFRGKHVLISGGGDSAVDWANELLPIAAQVYVVHRREQFAAHENQVANMMKEARVFVPYKVDKLHGSGETIHSVDIVHSDTGDSITLEIDAVVISHGFIRDYGEIGNWGLKMNHNIIAANETMATNIPGVFVAGDIASHGSKVKLIAGAFNDAVLALNSAKLYLEPTADSMAYVSSHNERFLERNKKFNLGS
ncbi:NAD(P)/FAD-dependent oxidoreductase [Paenibacillus sinopodophylli]|uniref:NAD(P)/FAD-dependent oxidoreductase n=1 Tax=Paenibacillus sinopodophylli TaxID=1837342 RepID=UPI00110CF796|nr:NAD(P)/FAD-dependent oxidoreductase [Paenibacillus sinopodophylli]